MTNIISLFSGAGGLDLGFKKEGFNILWANEYDKSIWKTHEYNFPTTILNKKSIVDLNLSEIPKAFGIIGGPPCQSFSIAGAKRGTGDKRGRLFLEYIKILNYVKPDFFVAENVEGLLSQRHEKDLKEFLNLFEDAGYNVNYQVYNASDYGIPQDRKRVIFVGYLKKYNMFFSGLEKEEKIKLKDCLNGLGNPKEASNGKINKEAINNNEYMTGGFSSMFMSRNRVRNWEEQSFTILATARQIPIHPSAPKMEKIDKDKFEFKKGFEDMYRRLSIRECARIQTFPDEHKFIYDKIEDGYKMVGNAVPVELAKKIAKIIKFDLKI